MVLNHLYGRVDRRNKCILRFIFLLPGFVLISYTFFPSLSFIEMHTKVSLGLLTRLYYVDDMFRAVAWYHVVILLRNNCTDIRHAKTIYNIVVTNSLQIVGISPPPPITYFFLFLLLLNKCTRKNALYTL